AEPILETQTDKEDSSGLLVSADDENSDSKLIRMGRVDL
ncbi:unnamed protein product, partial [Didymodactylos carnosus]